MRPAAPTSNTRTGHDFILPENPHPALSLEKGEAIGASRCNAFVRLSHRGERIEVRGCARKSFFLLKCFERLA
jgi:hypothetical protein